MVELGDIRPKAGPRHYEKDYAFVPLPGASIATEGGFYALFTVYFGDSRLAAMLIWRFLTYYLTIVLGLAAVLIDGFRAEKRAPRGGAGPQEG